MIGSSNGGAGASGRDSSFLCLLAIYAAHLVLFHVLDVAPKLADFHQQQRTSFTIAPSTTTTTAAARHLHRHQDSMRINDTAFEQTANSVRDAGVDARNFDSNDILGGQLRHEIFTTSSQLDWESSSMDHHSLPSYPKIQFDLLFLLTWIECVKNVFATVALSSSTWGIISGCAIFLLTYTDRDNTLQI